MWFLWSFRFLRLRLNAGAYDEERSMRGNEYAKGVAFPRTVGGSCDR